MGETKRRKQHRREQVPPVKRMIKEPGGRFVHLGDDDPLPSPVHAHFCHSDESIRQILVEPEERPGGAGDGESKALWDAVREKRIAMVMVFQDGVGLPDPPAGPWVLLVGDDMTTTEARGPTAFPPGIRQYIKEANLVVVYSGSGVPLAYETAVRAAEMSPGAMSSGHGAVVIQTQPVAHHAWLDMVKRTNPEVPLLDILPGAGINLGKAWAAGATEPQRRRLEAERRARWLAEGEGP